MGYTHYFTFKESAVKPNKDGLARIDEDRFKIAVQRTKEILTPFMDLLADGDGHGTPTFEDNCICFNGKAPHEYESFYLDTKNSKGFNFCKTGREKYSFTVALACLIFKEVFGDDIKITSDGTMYEDVGEYNDYLKRKYTFDDVEEDWCKAYRIYEEFTDTPYYGEKISDKLPKADDEQ